MGAKAEGRLQRLKFHKRDRESCTELSVRLIKSSLLLNKKGLTVITTMDSAQPEIIVLYKTTSKLILSNISKWLNQLINKLITTLQRKRMPS